MNELCVAYESARMNGVELASVHEIRMWEKDESSLYVRLNVTSVIRRLSK